MCDVIILKMKDRFLYFDYPQATQLFHSQSAPKYSKEFQVDVLEISVFCTSISRPDLFKNREVVYSQPEFSQIIGVTNSFTTYATT